MRSRDEVLTVDTINDRLRALESQQAASEPNAALNSVLVDLFVRIRRGDTVNVADIERRVRDAVCNDAASEPLTHDHAARLLREMYSTDELRAELARRGAASEPVAWAVRRGDVYPWRVFRDYDSAVHYSEGENTITPLYAHPSAAAVRALVERIKRDLARYNSDDELQRIVDTAASEGASA